MGNLFQASDGPGSGLPELRARIAAQVEALAGTPYERALRGSVLELLERGEQDLEWAPARVVYDSPEKAARDGEPSQRITTALAAAIQEAEKEFLLISPYFVPLGDGVDYFQTLRDRGVRVVVVTNSLASTNHPPVHSGYAPYRDDLLDIGVELYEVRADSRVAGTERSGNEDADAALHVKAFVVDRRELFVGSLNWDPRSVLINTEMGILIDSPALAGMVADRVDRALPVSTYRVVLDERRRVRWIGTEEGREVVWKREPQASFWRRFVAGFARMLPIRKQL